MKCRACCVATLRQVAAPQQGGVDGGRSVSYLVGDDYIGSIAVVLAAAGVVVVGFVAVGVLAAGVDAAGVVVASDVAAGVVAPGVVAVGVVTADVVAVGVAAAGVFDKQVWCFQSPSGTKLHSFDVVGVLDMENLKNTYHYYGLL